MGNLKNKSIALCMFYLLHNKRRFQLKDEDHGGFTAKNGTTGPTLNALVREEKMDIYRLVISSHFAFIHRTFQEDIRFSSFMLSCYRFQDRMEDEDDCVLHIGELYMQRVIKAVKQ
ncbi:hypothetical protein ILYODFUR_015427 [Ilyodon furcidens]|uniref:Uncharacterized protein n=1 Tax=Ilyodon furcidens TaxID=33524 RepID=A0ABV0VE80_9TELE